MKITAIKQQLKRVDRYSVFVDDAYAFSLSEAALLSSGLASGQELSAAQLADLKETSHADKAYGNALRYVALRPRSEWELTSYLARREVDQPVVQQITEKLRSLDLLDDHKFAESWVANRRLLKPVSIRRLTQELKQKHVADDIILQVLQADEVVESDVLAELVARKRRQAKYQDNTKLMQYLARQGFGYDDIKRVLAQGPD